MTNPPDPDSPPPRTTGGNWRWEPPTPAALDAMLPGYTVEKLLGQGGMGAVYKGVQISLDRPVAIKILPGGIEKEDPSYSERFRNEARVMARLLHPAIVAVFDFGQTPDGQLYFVMEYVDGTDIHQMIASQGKLSAEHALAITAHVCDALTAAHGLGIVHRDIKPANVLINLQGQVKVADFGLAKVDEPGQHGITKTGYALGTPDFVAPEALVLGVNVDARADLYAVGVMLYQMLTGELPRGAWKAPSEKVPGLDHRFDAIVVKAMQGDPGDRHQSAVELRRDLDVILTVPLVKADAPPTSALPQQAVADLPAQRSAAAVKVTPRGKRAAKVPGQVAAPVKLPSKAAGSGSKVRFLPIGIGAAILLVASVFYGLKGRETASKPSPKGAPADPQTVVAASDSPPSGPPTPKATQKIPEPKPNPTAPATTPAKAPNSAPPAFGAYPAGLKVPVPDWLRKASEEGGRLEFIKTDGLPKEFDPLFDLGEAAKFDDFVAVYRGPYRWMAIRKGGDVWGKTWLADYRSIQSFGPIPAVSIVRTFNPIIVGQDSKVYYLATGDKPHPRAESPNVMGAIGQSNSSGFLHVLLGASNETLETRNTLDGLIPPPPDFFRGASAIGAASGSYFAATPGQPLRSWDHKTGAPVPIKDPPSDVVEIAGGGTDLLVLSSAGDIRVIHATTGTLYPSGGRPPSDLGPAIRVRRAGVCFLAQRTTGTWMAWQTSTDEKISDRSDLMRLIGDFGPALDMESHFISLPGKETAGFWALAIRPKTTADAAPAKPANQLTAAPPASLSGPTVPDWLVEARKQGGKLHFFGTAYGNATERGRVEEFDDVVDVQMDGMGVAVRRINGETHSVVWKKELPSGGFVPSVLKTPAIGHGHVVGLFSDTSPGFHLLWAGQFVGVKGVTQPQATATAHTQYHITTLGTGGKILGSVTRSNSDEKSKDNEAPPADFFLGATAYTGTMMHYISARPGQPVRSWDVKEHTLHEFPPEIHDVVNMHASGSHVVLLTAAGRVFVTKPDGSPLTSSITPEGIVPENLGPVIGIAAGQSMSAAQLTDGTWRAWGRSPKLIEQTQKIGPAVAVDYLHAKGMAESMVWIEPTTVTPAPAPAMTQTTSAQAAPPEAPTPPLPSPSLSPGEFQLAATLLAKAKTKGGKLRALGNGPNGPFDVGAASAFDDFVQVTANHHGWAARRVGGEIHAGSWGTSSSQPYVPLGPFETNYLSRAALINMVLNDGTSRNVWSTGSQQNTSQAPGADRIIAVMNFMIRLEPDGKQHWLYGSASPEKPDFFAGASSITGTYDYFIRHRPGEPVQSWIPKNGTEFSFPDATRDTVEMDGGQDHVILLDTNGKVQVWSADGKPLDPALPLMANLPNDSGPFVAVRAGRGMSAAQRADGTWVAWGESESLGKEIAGLGKALDLDLFHDDKASFAMWIEPNKEASKLTETANRFGDLVAIPGFKSRLEGYLGARRSQVGDLAAKYLRGLDARLNQAADAGDLPLSKAFRDEKARVEALQKALATPPTDLLAAAAESATLPALPEASPDGLTALRATWKTERQKIRDDLDGKLRQSLQALETELTKAREFEKAEAVAAYREVFGKDSTVPTPPSTVAAEKPVPASTPAANSAVASSTLKLPPWLEQAAKSGGKLRIWGMWDGKPIEERDALKEFRESDYTQVMTGQYGVILGVRQRGSGKCFVMEDSVPGIGSNRLREFKSIDRIERTIGLWASEDQLFRDPRRDGPERNLGSDSLFVGTRSGSRLIRDRSGEWLATGVHFTNPEDPTIVPLMKSISERLKADQPSLISMNDNFSLVWVTKDTQLKALDIELRPGRVREIGVSSQPKEPLVQLFATSGSIYGDWLALGKSGAVYAEKMGGFDNPVTELTSALALRFQRVGSPHVLAARKSDGTWLAIGTEEKVITHLATVGPALDLDVYLGDDQNYFVLWIEPNSALKPK